MEAIHSIECANSAGRPFGLVSEQIVPTYEAISNPWGGSGRYSNLLLHSEDFGTTWAPVNITVTTDSTTAPNGTPTADKIQITSGSNCYVWGAQLEEDAADMGAYVETVASNVSTVRRGVVSSDYMTLSPNNGNVGTFSFPAAASVTVNNSSVTANSIIVVFPTNVSAAQLVSGERSPSSVPSLTIIISRNSVKYRIQKCILGYIWEL